MLNLAVSIPLGTRNPKAKRKAGAKQTKNNSEFFEGTEKLTFFIFEFQIQYKKAIFRLVLDGKLPFSLSFLFFFT